MIGWGGVTAKGVLDQLPAADEDLEILINSPGGSVTEGLAIYSTLQRRTGKTVASIDGLCASIASVIAMAADEVRIADTALFMIHNPTVWADGDAEEMRKNAEILDLMQAQILTAYERKTGLTQKELSKLMDAETWLSASDAVALGFADMIIGGMEAAAVADFRKSFDNKIKAKMETEILPNEEEAVEEKTIGEKIDKLTDAVNALTAENGELRKQLSAMQEASAKADELLHTLEKARGVASAITEVPASPQRAATATATRKDFEAMTHDQRNNFFRNGGRITE